MRRVLAASMLMALAGAGTAMAGDDCRVPMDQWQPREAVQKMAEARGWKVDRIKVDDGCYEIRGLDEVGRRLKAKIDPGSLEIVKMKVSRQERRERSAATTPATPNPLGGGGGAPAARVR